MAIAAVLVAVAVLCSADIPPGGTVAVTGDITLMRQDNGQPAVLFPLAAGGVGHFTRPDSRWWLSWPVLSLEPRGPVIKRSTVFASGYSGFEMLGTDGGTLTFAWRGNNNLENPGWHGPGSVLVNGDPLQGVRGRPGFLQYPTYVPGQSQPVWQFLALVPQDVGGVGLYERVEPGPFDWGTHQFGVIARQLGLIDSVTTVMTGNGGLVAVVRAGSRLYELSHARGHLSADFGTGWSPPTEVRTAGGGGISVAGDAELINATSRPGGTHLDR